MSDTTGYEMVVGVEVHVQLKTATKLFCRSSSAYGAPPNTNVCPVCLALPGALPIINAHAIELATRAALALGCTVHEESIFARKHYFYPDLPKGYQISQYDRPLATGGLLTVGPLAVRITRVHLEEDAGKSIHDRYPGATAIDLNRAGVPLIEIVSEPDIRSAADAGRYLRELRRIMLYTDVSDVNMEEGSLRVDANVSARRAGTTTLGTKTEVKNLNSFSNVERALTAEFARQCAALDRGERIVQQTMLWDAIAGEVRAARSKEESHDYRYFPEPDLPPLVVTEAFIARVRAELPTLPNEQRAELARVYGLEPMVVEELIASAAVPYFMEVAAGGVQPETAANWIRQQVIGKEPPVSAAQTAALLTAVDANTISHTAAKGAWDKMVATGVPVEQAIADLAQVGDADALDGWIDAVWAEHPMEAQRFAAGERKLQGVLVGLVMRKSNGRADPKRVNQLLAARAAR